MEFDQTAMGEQLLEWTAMGENFDKMMADNIRKIGDTLFDQPVDITNPENVDIDIAGGNISFGGKPNPTGEDGNVNPTGMIEGGIVPGGFPNDTYPAMLSSGEKVIPDAIPLSSLKDSSSKTEHKVGGTITLNINGADVPQELKNQYTAEWIKNEIQKYATGNDLSNGGTSNKGIDYLSTQQI